MADPARGLHVQGVSLRAGTVADAQVVAELHARCITEGFLSQLGPAFLKRLYRRIVRSERAFLIVASLEDRVVGFVAGTEDTGRLYREFLLHDGVSAAIVALPRLLRQLPRVWETLRYGMGHEEARNVPAPELLAMAVSASARGRGLGAALVESFQEELVRRGIDSARVVVAGHNDVALNVYRRGGFTDATTTEVHGGTASSVLTWHGGPSWHGEGT